MDGDSPVLDAASTGVEFFHIYTDEKINGIHSASLKHLRETRDTWDFETSTIILVDNYNPTNHILAVEDVFEYLRNEGELPSYWAYEGDLVDNAKVLLKHITSNKIRTSYERYIENHGKYPCSLLTASWYLTRLGNLDHGKVVRQLNATSPYKPVSRIINILPADYKSVEDRALEIIKHSEFAAAADGIEDLFYEMRHDKDVKLF